ncbi:hypothetical protein K7I13_12170 [Brucepastera parasyntrophica]|uniref:hypothetical protein n=1 Tax=Brucepastera parasyntrophica TaxID=2880008 RepID=UPI00210DD799|nr:hypothetical protein [Brucepastera parasyntrophica]ULQ59241.1 hypothetical protein K7I13_12170 [Brucepastera parasyntrophica]
MPKKPTVQYSFDSVPEIPDDEAGVTYKSNFLSGVDGWAADGATISVDNGKLKTITTSTDPKLLRYNLGDAIKGQSLIFKLSGITCLN